ncbi:MAG: hypothetical protein NXI32_31495, partial [bacterium]|nr:hypothetical protein [bacterium]
TAPEQRSLSRDEFPKILDELVVDIMLTIVARPPTSHEQSLLKQYIRAQADGDPGLTSHDMLKVCQAVIGSTQFQFLD